METTIIFSHYGEERELNATAGELEMFSILCGMFEDCGGNLEEIRLTRKSDNYVTAVHRGWDLARFKCTDRAKWITFPVFDVGSKKHRIEQPDDITAYGDLVARSIEHIWKYT